MFSAYRRKNKLKGQLQLGILLWPNNPCAKHCLLLVNVFTMMIDTSPWACHRVGWCDCVGTDWLRNRVGIDHMSGDMVVLELKRV